MNIKLENFKNYIKGKKIDVLGIGISNIPLIKFLSENGAIVHACDKRTKEALGNVYDDLSGYVDSFSLGEEYLKNLTGEIVFKSPGIRFDVPEILEIKEKGAVITSEMELFVDFCPAKIIAVTGSDGKTTTTTLISKLLEREGYKTWLGGNIGNPLFCSLEEIKPEDMVVLELSSFQLHTMKKSPDIAVITNISPNHLDMHKDYQEYIDAKKNIMLYQNEDNILVYNNENSVTKSIGAESKAKTRSFGWDSAADTYVKDGSVYFKSNKVLDVSDIKIPGKHNVENYMAAISAVGDMVSVDTIDYIAKNFGGVEHRIEFVRNLNGIQFYNSSIDSSPNRTMNTLKVFPGKVILIAGGKDKGIPYDELGPVLAEHVKTLILIGATSEKIKEALLKTPGHDAVKVIECNEYNEAVAKAYESADNGDIVILSPASTSFDRFRNFEERGKLFMDLVNSL